MTKPTTNIYPEAVRAIKNAILRSRYLAARLANAEQLKLYYSIGGYVSANTRQGKWGTGAIAAISRSLQAELPGLRGFSEGNIKKMRLFFEEWSSLANRQTLFGELPSGTNRLLATDDLTECFSLAANRSTLSNDLEEQVWNAFLSVGFSQHIEILFYCKTEKERWYYIQQSAANFWSVRVLRRHLAAGDFSHIGTLPNNFALTMPDAQQVSRAVQSFKENICWISSISRKDFQKPIGVATYRIGSEIPEKYKPLIPMIDGVQKLLENPGSSGCGGQQ